MTRGTLIAWSLASTALLALTACSSDDSDTPVDPPQEKRPPNILLMVMDDIGIDQMRSFGYGGDTPPAMPNIDAIAEAGLRFHNTWGMPVCSPGRAAIFAGRYPFRTGLLQAIGPDDLANSQLSPYEVTIPQVLKAAGYESAMFGKFHLAGPDNNAAGNATPAVLGWDYFHGWIGLPEAIDKRAGGIVSEDTYSCGFVPGAAQGGAEQGACYYPDNSCTPMQRTAAHQDAPGLQCLDSGGIFVPDQSCAAPRPDTLDFNRENAYYVSPLVIADQNGVEAVPYNDPRARGYRTRLEANAAIEWINARQGSDKPWMAAVTFTTAHTPLQTPPGDLLPQSALHTDALDCSSIPAGRVLQNRMTEAMDTEFGRLLVETGLATRNSDGSLNYQPESSNTVIVIVTDNGTLGYSVKQPFSPDRAKGTTYQTGVWVPLIIAGPQVEDPGRRVEHMVNQVDLFEFFGELAGIDVHEVVPRRVDSAPLLPYLTNPDQPSIRSINFTMNGLGIQADGAAYPPCVITENLCSQIPTSKGVCEDNQGVWWGPGYDHPSVIDNGGVGYFSCGEVNQALYLNQQPMVNVQPEQFMAIRNENYKLVRATAQHYDPGTNTISKVDTEEFYRINQDVPVPLLDNEDLNLMPPPLTAEAQQAYDELHAKLEMLLASEPTCPGDGNRDGVVDAEDLANWRQIAQNWGKSSVYDFPVNGIYDGLTNHIDGAIIQQNMGLRCPPGPRLY